MDKNITVNKTVNHGPKKNKKRKLPVDNLKVTDEAPKFEEVQNATDEVDTILHVKNLKNSETNQQSLNTSLKTINKKIKIESDQSKSGNKKAKNKNPANQKHFNDDEAAVKDEDIEKFCDELDEKDNEQYENWVKLFEDNFRSYKKKKT